MRGAYVLLKPTRGSGKCHFCCILFIKASYVLSPDPGVGEINSTPSVLAIFAIYHKDSVSCRSRSAVHVESSWLVAPALNLPQSCCRLLSSVALGSGFTSLGLISSLILKAAYTHPACLAGCHEAQTRRWRKKGLLFHHLSLKQKEAGCSHWARASLPLSQIGCNSSEAKA